MKNVNCKQCEFEQDMEFDYCISCGNRMRCESCDTAIAKNAVFCSKCGNKVNIKTGDVTHNTIKFRETKEERFYEVAFTNEATRDVTNVLTNMLGTKGIGFSQNKEKQSEEEVADAETTDFVEAEVYNVEKSLNNSSISANIPHIDDLELKLGEINEIDWVLIYAYYLSDFGKGFFSKESVFEHYKSKRKTENRMKNYKRTYEKAFSAYFKTLNSEKILINEKGIKTSEIILRGEKITNYSKTKTVSKVKETSEKKGKIKSTSASSKNIKLEEFEAIGSAGNLINFHNSVKPSNNAENILLIAYFIQKNLKQSHFTDGNIDYGFKYLKLERQNNLRQLILNAKSREMWFEPAIEKSWKITRKGEIYIENLMARR
jgi:hypothetical protein